MITRRTTNPVGGGAVLQWCGPDNAMEGEGGNDEMFRL